MTTKMHWVFQSLTLLLHVINLNSGLVPVKYQAFGTFSLAAINAGLGLYNHYFNPDGTPASVSYVAKS